MDSSWVVSAGLNGLAAHNSPNWLSLYLSVCKLLDLALALPAQHLPQFQMYQWAFVSEGSVNNNVTKENSTAINGMQFYQVLSNFWFLYQIYSQFLLGFCSICCKGGQVAFAQIWLGSTHEFERRRASIDNDEYFVFGRLGAIFRRHL